MKENKGYKTRLDMSDLSPLKNKKTPVISAHHDADGLTSGALVAHALGKEYDDINFVFPKVFGATNQATKPDIVVDQAPPDPNYEGLVVDHHPAHFGEDRENKYKLVWDGTICASQIIYESLKEEIPEEYHWKVALGIAGDGGEDEIPSELFIKSPELLVESGYTYGKKYGSQMDYTPQYAYVMAKSLINYGTRVGDNDFTMQKFMKASSVLDIINDDWLLSCKKKIKKEMKNMYRDASQFKIDVYQDVGYCEYETDYRIWTAQDFYNRINKTAIALNSSTGSFSIRGPLANIFARMLNRIDGIHAGGHLHYAGGKITSREPKFLRQQISILDRNWRDEDVEEHL